MSEAVRDFADRNRPSLGDYHMSLFQDCESEKESFNIDNNVSFINYPSFVKITSSLNSAKSCL